MASFTSDDQGYHSSLLRVGTNLDVLFPLLLRQRFAIHLGPSVGMPIVRQHAGEDQLNRSYGFAYGAAATLSARIYGPTFLSLNLDAGGEVFKLNGNTLEHRATGSALLGGVVAF